MTKKSVRFKPDKYGKSWNGWESEGAWRLNVIMHNDQRLGNYVQKNKKALLSLPKQDKVSLIKKNASQSWSKDEAKRVKLSNVKASELNFILKDFF